MMIKTETLELQSKGHGDILDLTARVAEIVTQSKLKDGIVTVFVIGSTAAITTIEFEPNLVADFNEMWQKLAPEGVPYHHDNTWGDANGYAHVRASLLGASLVIPFNGGKLVLGTWQQVVLVDFDERPRRRKIVVQVMGK
ncbi:MAG: YjbQ family protein [Dehalococcoidia bacterium]|nr:MAG: YjbQ family protein [Dehalococcoidia bacterium]